MKSVVRFFVRYLFLIATAVFASVMLGLAAVNVGPVNPVISDPDAAAYCAQNNITDPLLQQHVVAGVRYLKQYGVWNHLVAAPLFYSWAGTNTDLIGNSYVTNGMIPTAWAQYSGGYSTNPFVERLVRPVTNCTLCLVERQFLNAPLMGQWGANADGRFAYMSMGGLFSTNAPAGNTSGFWFCWFDLNGIMPFEAQGYSYVNSTGVQSAFDHGINPGFNLMGGNYTGWTPPYLVPAGMYTMSRWLTAQTNMHQIWFDSEPCVGNNTGTNGFPTTVGATNQLNYLVLGLPATDATGGSSMLSFSGEAGLAFVLDTNCTYQMSIGMYKAWYALERYGDHVMFIHGDSIMSNFTNNTAPCWETNEYGYRWQFKHPNGLYQCRYQAGSSLPIPPAVFTGITNLPIETEADGVTDMGRNNSGQSPALTAYELETNYLPYDMHGGGWTMLGTYAVSNIVVSNLFAFNLLEQQQSVCKRYADLTDLGTNITNTANGQFVLSADFIHPSGTNATVFYDKAILRADGAQGVTGTIP